MFTETSLTDTALPGEVALRRMTTADAGAFASHVQPERERLFEHLPWPATTDTPEGATEWLGGYERQEHGRVLVAGAFHQGRLVGGALLFKHAPDHGTIEIGVWTTTEGQGTGLAASACRALLKYARQQLQVERVEWRASTANPRSKRLAERIGFTHEGTLRSDYVLHGRRISTDVLGIVGAEIDRAIT